MGRTSIKNEFILSLLLLLLIVMVVVSIVNLNSKSFYLAQAISTAIAMGFGIIRTFGGVGVMENGDVTMLLDPGSGLFDACTDGDIL